MGNSIYLAVPQYRGISYSWWEGDKIGTEEQKLPPLCELRPEQDLHRQGDPHRE